MQEGVYGQRQQIHKTNLLTLIQSYSQIYIMNEYIE